MSLLTGHGATTNTPVLGHTSTAPRVSTSKLIFCTIPGLNPPQRLAHRHELGARVRGDSAGFCLVWPILLRYVSMISRAEQRTVWINAYNAAMTGLLSAKAARVESYTENNVSVITEQCKACADQALKYVAAFASDILAL